MNNPLRSLLFSISMLAGLLSATAQEKGPTAEVRELTLREAIKLGATRAPEILIAESQASKANAATREAKAQNRPQVSIGTGLAYNNGYPLSMDGAAPSIFQVSATQPFFSKTNANLIREAEQSGKAGRFGVESMRNEMAVRTAQAYYNLHQLRISIEITTRQLTSAQKQQEIAETLLAAGRIRPIDALLIKSSINQINSRLFSMQEQVRLAEMELRELTGISESTKIRIVAPELDSPVFNLQPEALYRQAIGSAPDILQAESNLKAKEFHVEAGKGEKLPRFDIIGQYALFSKTNNYADYFNQFTRNNYIIGLSLQVPIFDGFRADSRTAQNRQEATEARLKLEQSKSKLKMGIEKGFSAYKVAMNAAETAKKDVEAAEEMVKVSDILCESGKIGEKDLEETRSMQQQKELLLVEANRALFERKLDLLGVSGAIASLFQ